MGWTQTQMRISVLLGWVGQLQFFGVSLRVLRMAHSDWFHLWGLWSLKIWLRTGLPAWCENRRQLSQSEPKPHSHLQLGLYSPGTRPLQATNRDLPPCWIRWSPSFDCRWSLLSRICSAQTLYPSLHLSFPPLSITSEPSSLPLSHKSLAARPISRLDGLGPLPQ